MRKPSPFLNHSFVAPWAIARVTKDSGPTQLIKHQFYRETKRAAFPAFQISIKMQIMEKWKWIHSITTPAKKGTEFAEKSFKRLFPCVAVDSFLSERTCERASEKKCREEVEGGGGGETNETNFSRSSVIFNSETEEVRCEDLLQ